jgi:hypothetical protein
VALFSLSAAGYSQTVEDTPHLLLNSQRLRRLKRDRTRQTVRWVNFENRVQTVPDSPERGFELALYYAVTGDEARGREAIAWALQHPDHRQIALVLDWCGPLLTDEQRKQLIAHAPTVAVYSSAPPARDSYFMSLASGHVPPTYTDVQTRSFIDNLQRGAFSDSEQLYAACEFLMAYRASQRVDLRESAVHFFADLPTEFLLSLKPDKAEHPDWMTHIAALALVAVDPNLQASQFLQGWAMEDRQMIREGPGVAFEFLWADPYLPGVGYQNLDPWAYDPDAGRLFARTDWSPQACWIGISKSGIQNEHCALNWQNTTAKFGHLSLVPMTTECAELPQRKGNDFAILWKLPPNQVVTFTAEEEQHTAQADSSGMLRLGGNISGKVCLPRQSKR